MKQLEEIGYDSTYHMESNGTRYYSATKRNRVSMVVISAIVSGMTPGSNHVHSSLSDMTVSR